MIANSRVDHVHWFEWRGDANVVFIRINPALASPITRRRRGGGGGGLFGRLGRAMFFALTLCMIIVVAEGGRTRKHTPFARALSAPLGLSRVPTVGKETEAIASQAELLFTGWLVEIGVAVAVPVLAGGPMLLGRLIEKFGSGLYEVGCSLGIYRHLVTWHQRGFPYLRGHLPRSWTLSRWGSVEPTMHREPAPLVFAHAIVSVAFLRGYFDFGMITLMMFHFILRPCEAIKALRSDLVLPSDTFSDEIIAYVRIPMSKAKWQDPRTQHASCKNGRFNLMLETLCVSAK